MHRMAISEIGLILLSVTATSVAQILLKIGMTSTATQQTITRGLSIGRSFSVLFSPWVFGGLLIYAGAALLWLAVLARSQISFAYPFVALGFVFTTIAGHFLFGENLNVTRIVSVSVICIGVALLANS